MLRRRSIRTKLVYALTVLTMIFCFLAFSGVWGVQRYRELADSVSQQAVQIPFANDLVRTANSIRRGYGQLAEIRDQRGILGPSFLARHEIKTANAAIDGDLRHIQITLDAYATQVSTGKDDVQMLVDKSLQQQSLWEIQEALDAIRDKWGQVNLDTNDGHDRFVDRTNELVAQAESHLELIHSEMAKFSEQVNGQYDRWIWFNLVCTVTAIVLLLLLWFSFKSMVAQPFQTLLEGSRLVAAGQYGHRIDLGTSDELSELADAMNSMSTKFRDVYDRQNELNAELDEQVRQRTREVIQNEQLASVGFLAAGVAHEINNPLASIAWSAESLQSDLDDVLMAGTGIQSNPEFTEALQSNLQRIQDEAYRCKGITDGLLDFSRLGDVSRSSTDLCKLVHSVVSIVSKLGKYKCKTIRIHSDDQVHAHVNSHEIQQVILNLVTNALESVSTDGAVDVHVRTRGQSAYVGVYDDGCGMSQQVLDHLFEPFFTRRRDGTGTGLGLSITYRIVSQHHGSLTASSDGDGKGSKLELTLPVNAVTKETLSNQTNLGWEHDAKAVA
ncbi:sensor histidine kinase [Planctomycetes bacterium K23_9]|uniref:histidine kinase n=1 Tax=Stieleria marina TaxID=1930275 RepID=A0A517NTI4_9BACT|nr:Sensor protein ZraS [Planctomycetes bacterium K23_9]